MLTRTSASLALAAVFALCSASALAQRRSPRQRRPPPPAAPAEAAPPARSEIDLGEVIPVPVSAVDGMLRRMRVYLFTAPSASSAYGLAALGRGRRIWALLPSCRTTNPDDDREPCPVDRLTVEAVIRGNVNAGTPAFIGGVADGRRVQSFVVEEGTARVRLRVLGPASRIRYEAVVEADRLSDLHPPEGSATPGGFTFDLTRYPAR